MRPSPEMLGLPAACLYVLVLFVFIPCRYMEDTFPVGMVGQSQDRLPKREAVRALLGVGLVPQDQECWGEWLKGRTVGTEFVETLERMQPDGGWMGHMSGLQDFPHHQVRLRISLLTKICCISKMERG